ncbi:serine hydrolase [Streptosporangium lutulentum]
MGTGNSGFSEAGLRRLRDVLERHVESKKIPGLVALVGRGDQTHVEALGTMRHDGGAPMSRDTIFRMASTTKPVAAAATMVLLDECGCGWTTRWIGGCPNSPTARCSSGPTVRWTTPCRPAADHRARPAHLHVRARAGHDGDGFADDERALRAGGLRPGGRMAVAGVGAG